MIPSSTDFKSLLEQAQQQMQNGTIGTSGTTKQDPQVFMGTTPGRLPAGAGVFDQFSSVPKDLRDRPGPPNRSGMKYVPGPGGEMTEVPVTTAPPPDKGTPPVDNLLSQTAAENAPLQWGKAKIEKAIKRAQALGYNVTTFADFLKVWNASVDQAATAYNGGAGKKISPWDMMDLLAVGADTSGQNGSSGAALPFTGVKSTTSVNTSVDDVDPGAAASIIDSALTQYLGRAATDQEKADFLSRANGLARANPSVTKSVTDTTYKQGEAVGSNTTSSSTGGITQDDLLQSAEQRAKQNPDYGAYQAASTIMGWLNQAVAAPV